MSAFAVAIGGKADMPFCTAHVCFCREKRAGRVSAPAWQRHRRGPSVNAPDQGDRGIAARANRRLFERPRRYRRDLYCPKAASPGLRRSGIEGRHPPNALSVVSFNPCK